MGLSLSGSQEPLLEDSPLYKYFPVSPGLFLQWLFRIHKDVFPFLPFKLNHATSPFQSEIELYYPSEGREPSLYELKEGRSSHIT